jgi:hypothetical protein
LHATYTKGIADPIVATRWLKESTARLNKQRLLDFVKMMILINKDTEWQSMAHKYFHELHPADFKILEKNFAKPSSK